MAEVVLGTVASAAGLSGLTIQLLESGRKIESFYDDVKDPPEDLKHLQGRLNTLAVLLQTIRSSENMMQLLTRSPQFEQCMTSCQAASEEVKLFANRLESGMIKNKRWGAIKCVLKKDDLVKLDKRLERAISLLHLCCSLHGIELFQTILQAVQSLQVLVQLPQAATLAVSTPTPGRISSTLVSMSSSSWQDENDVEEIPRTFEDNRFRTASVIRKKKPRLHLPFFFYNKIWEFQYRHSISGWDVKLTSRRIVPSGSDILTRAAKADLEGVKALLMTNQASIFDEDEYGRNTISV
ncbi:hypothetical protein BDV97DRAFT_108851 [Delphinella strobiligena]|nr:hypothetical protein BDV97DRAFT_108851 [Delphinella strobiligena]